MHDCYYQARNRCIERNYFRLMDCWERGHFRYVSLHVQARYCSVKMAAEFPDTSDKDNIDKGIFVRALAEARLRNPGTALASYIEGFITVQASASVKHSCAEQPA